MPTYHYVCPKCDHDFELFTQRISDSPKTKKCPACGGRARRQISGGSGFLFKGEGFYVTDYRSEEYRSKAKKDREAGAKPKAEDSKETGTSSGSAADAPLPAKKEKKKPKESNDT